MVFDEHVICNLIFLLGRGVDEVRNNDPPTYTNCPPSDIQLTYIAGNLETTVAVNWSEPTASSDAIS